MVGLYILNQFTMRRDANKQKNYVLTIQKIMNPIILFSLLLSLIQLHQLINSKKLTSIEKDVYNSFYTQEFKGKITGVDAGRGVKIRLDTCHHYIIMPGYSCIDSGCDFTFGTGENIGDSLIKKAGSDTFFIKQFDSKIMTLKITN